MVKCKNQCRDHQKVVELLEDCIAEFQLAADLEINCIDYTPLIERIEDILDKGDEVI